MALGITPGYPGVGHYWPNKSPQAYAAKPDNCADSPAAQDDGARVIGLAMLPYGNSNTSYGLKAQYAPGSTKQDPVIRVTSNYGGETTSYDIHINEVNPRNATELEMFALLSYTDDQNISNGGTFGSYQRMKTYAENARMNGYWEGNDSFEDFQHTSHDWQKLMVHMWEDYSKAGIFSQMVNCIGLHDTMEQFSRQFIDFDNLTLTDRSAETSLRYTGPQLSGEVAKAWFEAAEEAQMPPGIADRMLQRVMKWAQGGENKDVSGDSISSALKAAKEALQALEFPLMPEMANSPQIQQETQKEKELYQVFIRKLEQLQSGRTDQKNSSTAAESGADEEEKDYLQLLRDHMEQMFIKLQNGDTEPKFQIGSQSFTIKEWEEFLEKFDEVEEAIRELQQQDIEKRKAQAEEDARLQMLTSETMQAHFPLSETNADGTPKEDLYLTAIDRNGIRCSSPGSAVYEWEITFTSEAQYQQAKDLLEWANANASDCRFAANQSFWQALLSGNLDEKAFRKFLEGAENGNAGRSADSHVSFSMATSGRQWTNYMNHPDAKSCIAEEMAKKAAQELEERVKNKNIRSGTAHLFLPIEHMENEDSLGYTEICQRYYPGYAGEAIFCEYPGGPLYTAEETGRRMYEKALHVQEAEGLL
ncbi:MAG: hypothetical protein HFI75_08195 [Lachnospiraceae bacterium]|nr:hypothetical protein [Lachnospiraceae bacterium]